MKFIVFLLFLGLVWFLIKVVYLATRINQEVKRHQEGMNQNQYAGENGRGEKDISGRVKIIEEKKPDGSA